MHTRNTLESLIAESDLSLVEHLEVIPTIWKDGVELFFNENITIAPEETVVINTGVHYSIPEGKVLSVYQLADGTTPFLFLPHVQGTLKVPVTNATDKEVFYSKDDTLCLLELIDDPNLKLDLSMEVPPNGIKY